jgi:hypothetical protein
MFAINAEIVCIFHLIGVKFLNTERKACRLSSSWDNLLTNCIDHFVGANKMVHIGPGVKREIDDMMFTHYAWYLNGNPCKKVFNGQYTQ